MIRLTWLVNKIQLISSTARFNKWTPSTIKMQLISQEEEYYGDEIVSSLPLQMALYFNVIFFPFWLISNIAMLHLKFDCLSTMYQFIVVTVFVTIIGIEGLRLYLGYLGNLTEKLPEMAGFWMLSLFLQLPLQLFLLINENMNPSPLEYTVQLVMLSLLIAQLLSGFEALRHAVSSQTNRFRLHNIYSSGDGRKQFGKIDTKLE